MKKAQVVPPAPDTQKLKEWAKEQPARDQSKLLDAIDKAIASKTRPKIRAYSCHNYHVPGGCSAGCVRKGQKEISGRKIYWVKGRPYTLKGGVWGSEYSETVLNLEDLKG